MADYDNIYVFHDAENCYLPSKIEARDSSNKLIKLPNGRVQFLERMPGAGAIQGAYVYKEVIRTALACKIGREKAENVEITALDTNIIYHFVISPKALDTPFYPSESTLKDFVDIGGGNFNIYVPPDKKDPESWADKKIKELWDSQAELCKKSFSREAITRTLFILISGDRDFATQIRNARKTGLDVSVIYSMDSPIRGSIFEILRRRELATEKLKWATGNWLDIVWESRKRGQVIPNPYIPNPNPHIPNPPNEPAVGRREANLLYDFIVQWAADKAYPESRMLVSETQRFFKSHPEVKHKLTDYCNAYPDLFDRYKDAGADWVRCIEKKAPVDPQRVEANQLYDFIVQWAAKKAYPESRMLASDVPFFFKEYPGVKAKMGSLKISEFCSANPDLFDIRHDGTAVWIHCIPKKGTIGNVEKNELFDDKIQVEGLVAFYAKMFMSQAMNDSVVTIKPVLQVKIAPVIDNEKKKWFATIYADDYGKSAVSPLDFQEAWEKVRPLLDTITIDQPIELRGIQPEVLRDNSELRDLARKEKVFFSITNLSKVAGPGLHVSTSSPMLSPAKIDSPVKINRSTIMPEFFVDNAAEIKNILRCAESLREYILSTGSDLQPIHMAAYYGQFPEMKAILKNQKFKLKDFCRAFPHLLHMKVDNDKKEWIAACKYSDDAVHLYSFILEEGEMVNGSRRIAASKLGIFYKRYPQDENTIKQGNRKPKMFVQQHEDLFKWEDATVEVGFGYIYCAFCKSPDSSTSLKEATYKRGSDSSSSLVDVASTATSTVVQVYTRRNVAGKERVRQFMQSLCRITDQYSVHDKAQIQMCKTAWPILSATALDVKVGYSSTRDSFNISATGTPDAAKSYIDLMKDRVGTIESCLRKIPANKQECIGLLEGVRQKADEILAGEGNAVAAGYTSYYCELESQKIFKSVVISFLPPWDSNVDANDERQLFDSLVATMKDVIDTYDEAVCHSRKFRRGINISEVKGRFSLYHANFNKINGNFFFCGDSQSVKAALEWLTVVPTAEKEISQIFKVSDGRLVFMLRNSRHAKVIVELKGAVVEGGSRKVAISPLVGHNNSYKALFAVKGPTAYVESAIAKGQAFMDRWVATFLDRYLLGTGQVDLPISQINFLKNEGLYLIKKTSNEFGISLKSVSNDNQSEGPSKVVSLLFAKIGSVEIRVAQGDMLRVECDVIINPANSRLAHAAGAARAISEAAGPELNAQCEDILKRFDGSLPMSEAVVTDSYDLKRFNQYSKIVVHSVGPKYSTGSSTEIECYQQTITNALDKAVENGATYIAMPLIGSGVFGWPVELAAREMLGVISKWIGAGNSCKRIILIDLEKEKAAVMVNTVQLFNEKVAPLLISNSKKAATATATAMKVPQFSWYWEVYSHERDPQGNLYFDHPDTITEGALAHWIPYDYDQVLQIEAGIASDSFPVILKGDVSGVTNNAFYLIYKGKRPDPQKEGKRLPSSFDSMGEFYQENSVTKSTRIVLKGKPFDPISGVMHGYNKGVLAVPDAVADRFSLVEDIQIASETVKKEGFEIFGPQDLVLSAESAIQAALSKETKMSQPLDLQVSAPEDWDSVLQRLRTHLLVQQSNAIVVDASSTSPRTVTIQAMGSQALLQAEKEFMKFVLSISLERSAELSVKWPEEWTGGPDADNSSTTLVPVDRDSDEWQKVEAEWRKVGHPSRTISAELLKVERVQNVKAWEAYYSRVRLLAGRNKESLSSGTSVFQRANEQWMKHGTRTTSPEIIYSGEQGLDCRYSGKGFFGIAAYTAEDAYYSDKYCYNIDDGTKQMFLVRVAAGNVHEVATRSETHRSLVHPPSGFDSVRGCVLEPNFMAIMVYQPDSAYPAYLLTYKAN